VAFKASFPASDDDLKCTGIHGVHNWPEKPAQYLQFLEIFIAMLLKNEKPISGPDQATTLP
jgi:hypothetical protein